MYLHCGMLLVQYVLSPIFHRDTYVMNRVALHFLTFYFKTVALVLFFSCLKEFFSDMMVKLHNKYEWICRNITGIYQIYIYIIIIHFL